MIIDGLAQDCTNSIANTRELLQSCAWAIDIKSTSTQLPNELHRFNYMTKYQDKGPSNDSGPLLLTWFNFNPSMDK